MKNSSKIFLAILFSSFLAIFFLFLKPPTDPDLFWHLRYGEEILKTYKIPYENHFSFTFLGYRAADSWWLSEVLIFWLVSKTGFFLPTLLFAALGAVTFLAVGFWARVGKASAGAISGAAFFGAFVSWQILGLRPQTISLALLGLVFILLHQFWLGKRVKLIFFLPLIFILWANLHTGFALGLILIWLFWSLELSRILIQKYFKLPKLEFPQLTPSRLKLLLGINALSTLGTLVNPYGIGLWQTIFNDAASPKIKNEILEWLAPNFHSELGLLFLFYLFILVVLAWRTKIKIHPTRFLILGTFCFLALAAVRHISVFVLLATPLLAEELSLLPWKKFAFPYKNLALALFFLTFALVWAWQFFPRTFKATRSGRNLAIIGGYPYEAVEYLKKHPQKRIFNEYGWGGFLIWQLPQGKTFIDGRMPGWRKDGREIFGDYIKVVDLEKDLQEVLDFWAVETFLISPDTPLAQYLKIHSDWEERYRDETAVIFARR